MEFFKVVFEVFPEHVAGSVIDIGSLDINGGPHRLISPSRYVGVDLGEGPNVDLVERGEELGFASAEFDVSMSSECFEHNPHWRATLHNMVRMTKPGGLIVFTCATTGRAEHGTSRSDGGASAPLATQIGQEYYHNVTVEDVTECLKGSKVSNIVMRTYRPSSDLMVIALRDPAPDELALRLRDCNDLLNQTFGNPRYTGSFLRHVMITLFGDSGEILYRRASQWVRKLRT
jgi:SAM-dependent methyltransferase